MPNKANPSLPFVHVSLIAAGPSHTTHNDDARVPEGQFGSQHYAILALKLEVFKPDPVTPVGTPLVIDIHMRKSDAHRRVNPEFQHRPGNQALLARSYQAQLSLAAAEGEAIRYLKSLGLRQQQMILCAFDNFHQQAFITHQMPTLGRFMGARNLDLQALTSLLPVTPDPQVNKGAPPTPPLSRAFCTLQRLFYTECMA